MSCLLEHSSELPNSLLLCPGPKRSFKRNRTNKPHVISIMVLFWCGLDLVYMSVFISFGFLLCFCFFERVSRSHKLWLALNLPFFCLSQMNDGLQKDAASNFALKTWRPFSVLQTPVQNWSTGYSFACTVLAGQGDSKMAAFLDAVPVWLVHASRKFYCPVSSALGHICPVSTFMVWKRNV